MAEAYDYDMSFITKLRDLEERQRLLGERALLIGKNLVESKEKINLELDELKKDVEIMKQDVVRIKEILERITEELSTYARREEVAILARQFKMFEPLKFARIEDVERMLKHKK